MNKILILTALLCFTELLAADNGIDVKVRIGNNADVDTIWVGALANFDFYFENDIALSGFTAYFRVYSADGVGWTWAEGVYRIDPPADTIWKYATVEEGSRMYPPDDVWDYYGLGVFLLNFDGSTPDTLLLSGASSHDPVMTVGPLEHEITARFRASGPVGSQVATVCIDTTRGG